VYSPDGEGCRTFCEDALFGYAYQYFEAFQTEKAIQKLAEERESILYIYSFGKPYPFPATPGLYRFHLEPNDGREACNAYNAWIIRENFEYKLKSPRYTKSCVVAEPIEKVSAEYGFE